MNCKQYIKVFSPASIANVGPGFDTFALALEGLGDTIEVFRVDGDTIEVIVEGEHSQHVPKNWKLNSVGGVIQYFKKKYGFKGGLKVKVVKGVPVGKGLGSSGASAAGIAYALTKIFNLKITDRELVRLAAEGERVVSGSAHPDNVSGSLFGGFVIVTPELNVLKLNPPEMEIVIGIPELKNQRNKTRKARQVIPKKIKLEHAVKNIGYASMVTAAVILNKPDLFGKNLLDYLAEPHRSESIPGYKELKKELMKNGAYGCAIAGAGPSIFTIGKNSGELREIIKRKFEEQNIKCKVMVTKPSLTGVKEIKG